MDLGSGGIDGRGHRRQQGHGAGDRGDPRRRGRPRGGDGQGQAALDAAVTALRGRGRAGRRRHQRRHDATPTRSRPASPRSPQRWGELNSLVHTIGPGDGYFEEMDDAEWEQAFALGTMSGVRSIRAALPLLRAARVGPDRDAVRALDPAAEPAHRRLHRVEGGAEQRHQEPVEKPCQGRHSGQLRVSRHHRHRELHRESEGHPRRRRPRCDRSAATS